MKAIFFDFGRTLVEHPEDGAGETVVRRYGITDETEVRLVRDALFSLKGAMKKLDDASISREEYKKSVLSAVPEHLHIKVSQAMDYPISWLPMIAGMEDLLKRLKASRHMLYIASNMDLFHAAQMRSHPIAGYFDNMIFSSEIAVGKPKTAYYLKLLEITGEKADNCVFIDDIEENVAAAENIGMAGFVFKGDAGAAERFINQIESNERI